MNPSFRVLVAALILTCLTSSSLFAAGSPHPGASQSSVPGMVAIPGPLRPMMRMSAVSQKIQPEDFMPLFARNVFSHGYEGPPDHATQTEYLILLKRYVQQARELAALAGTDGVLRVANCQEGKSLLKVLGYRARQDCGQADTYLETEDAERAFITTDSGFPLPALEKAMQGGKPFEYSFPNSSVPGLFSEKDWARAENARNMIDAILDDPLLARLYWAMSRLDTDTQNALLQSPGLKRLLPYSAVVDFYGTHICIRDGRVVVPGGAQADAAWEHLVGANPANSGEFVQRLVSKDKGWLAAYFDALSRVGAEQQAHFVNTKRLHDYYEALTESSEPPAAARPAFRPNSGLLLLATRLRWDANGDPHVPGSLAVWKNIMGRKTNNKIYNSWAKRAGKLTSNDELVAALFAVSRAQKENAALQMFLFANELDARRTEGHKLSPETVTALADDFAELSSQYLVFSEFPELDDQSIMSFLKTADSLSSIQSHVVKGNALGSFQALTGMWQIFARQGEISSSALNESWQKVVKPFGKINSATAAFDATRSSLRELLIAASGKAERSQDEIIDLLAGPRQTNSENQRMRQEIAGRIKSIMDSQRLVSLDTLLALGDGLRGKSLSPDEQENLARLAGQLREFEMPQPIFTKGERERWATGVYDNRHTDLQMRTDLTKTIKAPASAEQLAIARGQLIPFLRDTLVGLNYAYYEPPGAQMLRTNPLFVRSHDFSGDSVVGLNDIWQTPRIFGKGTPAGGGAHFVGSLSELPYVLSEAEQNFITPDSVQALIWEQVVPGLLTSAIVPRWWNVTQNELHAVTLYQRSGEELAIASIENTDLRAKVVGILSERMPPRRVLRLEKAMEAKDLSAIVPNLTPADTFFLAALFNQRFPDQKDVLGTAGKELDGLVQRYPSEVSWDKISRDFGVPHPVLTQTYGRELLNFEPFPAFSGYSSRLLAECWDSNNLYWARLTDEQGYKPVMLNRLVPELTRRMVEKIFATELEDWSALARAAHETGEEFRQGKFASATLDGVRSQQ
jgi:hypothetical protein